MSELKPCPRCETQGLQHVLTNKQMTHGWIVKCNICWASAPHESKDYKQAVDAWNKRAGENP